MENVIDSKGAKVEVGARVRVGCAVPDGIVVCVSDADGDVDDEGRQFGIPPHVEVRFDSGERDSFSSYSTATGPWDGGGAYVCDDVEVAAGPNNRLSLAASAIYASRAFEDPYEALGRDADCGPLIEKATAATSWPCSSGTGSRPSRSTPSCTRGSRRSIRR